MPATRTHRIALSAMAAASLLVAAPQLAAQPATAALIDAVEPRVVAWRRHIHENAELSYQEEKTAAYVADALRAMPGIEVKTGIAKTGVKAVLRGGKPGPVIALRADMDALPVEERNDLPFRSKAKAMWQGKETPVMHACGHDTHVAMLLGAAEVFSKVRAELPGTVVFLFQPAEEWGGQDSPSGAARMIAEGVMDNPKVEAVFGQHIGAAHPGGSIGWRKGGTLASGDGFYITVKGQGGHGAMPWLSKDPIVVAAHIVTALQTIVSREVNLPSGAAVVTVGQISGGNRINIIPEQALLSGTIRTFTDDTRKLATEAVERVAKRTAEAHGLTAEVRIERGYGVTSNNAELTGRMVAALERAAGKSMVAEAPPVMASEDFGDFARVVPGMFWFLNASPHADRAGAPNHSPQFMIDEKYMKTGVKALVEVALGYLAGKP
jgi:amidohydrolase